MSVSVSPERIIHVSSRGGYVDPDTISEDFACICSINPREGVRALQGQRTALFALDSYGNCATEMAKALISEGAYNAYVHYFYPRFNSNKTLLENRFQQLFRQLVPTQKGKGEGIDLFTTIFSIDFILGALKGKDRQVFDHLFILPSHQNKITVECSKIEKIVKASNEQLKKRFSSFSYLQFNGNLSFKTTPDIRSENQRGGYFSNFRSRDLYKVVAQKSKAFDPVTHKRLFKETLIITDCKNFLNQSSLSTAQNWKKEIPKKSCFDRLNGCRVAIVVHGMNNTAPEAYDSYGKLSSQIHMNYDYLIYYIWPGAGILAHQSYNNAQDRRLTSQYAELLKNLKNGSAKIDVIAHSMGNRFTLQTLKLLKSDFKNVLSNFFMVAPAVPHDCFEEEKKLYYQSSHLADNIFVLWTSHDNAMKVYPTYPMGAPSISGLGHGARNPQKLPPHVMTIELSSIVPGHGLAKFDKSFPLIQRLGAYKKERSAVKMDELQREVHAFFQERNLPLRNTQSVYLGHGVGEEGTVFERPVCDFKGNMTPTKCLYDPDGIFDNRVPLRSGL
ncbi:alpha/beta hydrolase [Candidatus Neptunochlamydia vexilliferae]|uniref:alpha/beta hydrolase n=1 Tax=Candidatus Neptunichlamydia vexilliferae TaxID=1651774 RepID=UPI001891D546|nr:alpha/beta hydrolase [Candidatus Neptunochlamydia vexilliferae]